MTFRSVLALLLLGATAACGSSYSSPPTSPTPPASGGGGATTGSPVSIVVGASTLTTTAYAPANVTIQAGGSVTWTNNDRVAHTSSSDNGAWNSGTIGAGQSFTHTFPAAGTFPYHCAIHPGMAGMVTVQ
jgi:plastocyanin